MKACVYARVCLGVIERLNMSSWREVDGRVLFWLFSADRESEERAQGDGTERRHRERGNRAREGTQREREATEE